MSYLTATQLAEWEVYLAIDPLSEQKQDVRMAYMASLITNLVIRSLGKSGAKLTSIKDFMIEWDFEKAGPKQQSPEEMKRILLGIAQEHNEKIGKK